MPAPDTSPNDRAARPTVIPFAIKEKAALYAAYIPWFADGGIFIPTSRTFRMGDQVYILLSLPGHPEPHTVVGQVAWITPSTTPGARRKGVGICFPSDDKSRRLRAKIEDILGSRMTSDRNTQTL